MATAQTLKDTILGMVKKTEPVGGKVDVPVLIFSKTWVSYALA
jgi:hypothetical protein